MYVNGEILPEREAKISVFDRGFLYGDGLFELIRFYNGRPFLWQEHLARFAAGCQILRMEPPLPAAHLRSAADRLLRANNMAEAFLRIHLSRGVGERGYSPRSATQPSLVMTVHPAPPRHQYENPRLLRVITASLALRNEDPLATAKHSNKLLQILARAEADEKGADEALLLNDRSEVLEASSANTFCLDGKNLLTPPVEAGVLPGITRRFVLELAVGLGMSVRETRVRPSDLLNLDGVFLTSTGLEIGEVIQLDGKPLKRSSSVEWLRKAYRRAALEQANLEK